jgi:hypothetical protein
MCDRSWVFSIKVTGTPTQEERYPLLDLKDESATPESGARYCMIQDLVGLLL